MDEITTETLATFARDVLRALESETEINNLVEHIIDRAVALDLGRCESEGFSQTHYYPGRPQAGPFGP